MILPLAFVYALTVLFWSLAAQPWLLRSPEWADGVLKICIWVIPTVALVMPWRPAGWRPALHELGLRLPGRPSALAPRPVAPPTLSWAVLGWTALATAPMVALLVIAPVSPNPASLVSDVVLGPFAEEVLYRGFLFQQLVLRARWKWPWAALGSAVVFALAHFRDLDEVLVMAVLRQDLTARLTELAPPAAATIVGGLLFAWMTWRWRSLWPAITLHAGINFWWALAPQAAHTPAASMAHGVTLVLATALTWGLTREARTSDFDAPSLPASPPPH